MVSQAIIPKLASAFSFSQAIEQPVPICESPHTLAWPSVLQGFSLGQLSSLGTSEPWLANISLVFPLNCSLFLSTQLARLTVALPSALLISLFILASSSALVGCSPALRLAPCWILPALSSVVPLSSPFHCQVPLKQERGEKSHFSKFNNKINNYK